MSVGLSTGSTPARIAAANTKLTQPTAHQNRVPSRRLRLAGASTGVSMLMSSAAMANPRVEHRVEHVDDEIHDDEAGGHEKHDALQNDEVTGVDRADEEAADPG